MARSDVLQIVVFSLLFGVAVGSLQQRAEPILRFAESVSAIAFQYTRYVMWAAPPAVFAAMAGITAKRGGGTLEALGRFVLTAWAAQAIFLLAVLGGSLVLARVPLRRFFHAIQGAVLVAFATTSSAAALPQMLDAMDRLQLPIRISGIVVPLSLSFNLAGSCIHLAMCALFVAQAAGIQLTWQQQAAILLTLKLTSKGVAGIPRANFVILGGLFASFGLPAEGLTLLLGVDALIDPVRTSVNVLGHCVAVPVLAAWEGEPLRPETDTQVGPRSPAELESPEP